jgi:3-phenylpropionate/cinnamic acid dioxygenase small subunit
VLALGACLAVAGWAFAQSGSRRAPVLTAQDYTEITELYARLYQGSDLRELDTWLSTFADDAVFSFPNGDEVSGKKALGEWRAKSFGGQVGDSRRRHWTSGVMLTPVSDGSVKARAYWLMLDARKKQPVVAESGTFDDLFVNTSAGGRYKPHAVKIDTATE